MSDFDNSSSQPPNDKAGLDGAKLYYRAIIQNLESTAETLAVAKNFIEFIDDPRFSGLALLHARDIEAVALAIRFTRQTLEFLNDPDPEEGDDETLISPDLAEEGRLSHEAH